MTGSRSTELPRAHTTHLNTSRECFKGTGCAALMAAGGAAQLVGYQSRFKSPPPKAQQALGTIIGCPHECGRLYDSGDNWISPSGWTTCRLPCGKRWGHEDDPEDSGHSCSARLQVLVPAGPQPPPAAGRPAVAKRPAPPLPLLEPCQLTREIELLQKKIDDLGGISRMNSRILVSIATRQDTILENVRALATVAAFGLACCGLLLVSRRR